MPGFHATITGRVQGVGFRFFVQGRAARLGLAGFVRNLPGGGVEVQAGGGRKALESLLADLHTGPGMSRVDHVDVIWTETGDITGGFTIRH